MQKEIPIIYADDPNFEQLMQEGKMATGVEDWLHKHGHKSFNNKRSENKSLRDLFIPQNNREK